MILNKLAVFKFLTLALLPAISLAGPTDTTWLQKSWSAALSNPVSSNVSLNEISIHAFRHFTKHYPKAAHEYWLKQDGRYIVSFSDPGGRTEVYYDRHGSFQYDVRYYEAYRLPVSIRQMQQNLYPDYSIAIVIDITDADHNNILLLKILSNQDLKTLRYFEGKMRVLDELDHTNSSPLQSWGD